MYAKLKLLPLLPILCGMSACATGSTGHVAAVSDYCRIAKPISYDILLDTKETIAQIEVHNSKYVCVCEGDCPKSEPS